MSGAPQDKTVNLTRFHHLWFGEAACEGKHESAIGAIMSGDLPIVDNLIGVRKIA